MRAGELRHRVTIQEAVTAQNSFGEETPSWQDVATVWAAVEPLQGREYFDAQKQVAEVDTRVRVRYRAGIGPTMRVVWGVHTYDIGAVLDVGGRHRELHLMCREVE